LDHPAFLAEIKHSVQSAQNRSKICVNDGQHKGYLLLPSQFNDEINNPQKYPIGTILHVTQVQNIVSNNKRYVELSSPGNPGTGCCGACLEQYAIHS
jgi:hypothetical protein